MIRVKYDKLYVVNPDQFEIISINDTETATEADCILDTPGTLNNDIIFQGSDDCDLYVAKKDNLSGLDFNTLENVSILSTKNINEFDFYIETNFVLDYCLKKDHKGSNHILIRNEDYNDGFG